VTPDDGNRYGSVGVYPLSRRRAAEAVVALWTGYRRGWKGEGRMVIFGLQLFLCCSAWGSLKRMPRTGLPCETTVEIGCWTLRYPGAKLRDLRFL